MLFVTITSVIECNINLEKNFGIKIKHKDDFPPKAIAISQKRESKSFVKLKVATFTAIRKLKNQNKSNTNKNRFRNQNGKNWSRKVSRKIAVPRTSGLCCLEIHALKTFRG